SSNLCDPPCIRWSYATLFRSRDQPPEGGEADGGQPPAEQGPRAPLAGAGSQVEQGDGQGGQFGGGVGAAAQQECCGGQQGRAPRDRKSTRLNSSHVKISYAVL